MESISAEPIHPGLYVKQNVLPPKLTVTEAAKLLGIGRPALSNFLNGKAALSAEMATRLERAFGVSQAILLNVQSEFDQFHHHATDSSVAVSAYVPNFLTIRARDIESWADQNIDARSLFAVLLRKLVHSTGRDLKKVEFCGYDNAERKGWDGFVECGSANPWIPKGHSGWEFGCNANPRVKAENDYQMRISQLSPKERAQITFVFVTPRNWPGKSSWEKEKNETGQWKAVRAFDASDLEQWLEQSIPGQIWFCERLGLPTTGFRTLDDCWKRWSQASSPAIPREVFRPVLEMHREKVVAWLTQPCSRPLIVSSESVEEAFAFLSCLFEDSKIASIPGSDGAAVFDSVETLKLLASGSGSFLPIVFSDEVEKELVAVCGRFHCISIKRKGIPESSPDICLEQLGHEEFRSAALCMGFSDDHADRLARETGRSLTILRRRLSTIVAIRTPNWACDAAKASALIPMLLVGAWRRTDEADTKVISLLANTAYAEVEKTLAEFSRLDDSPVWSTASVCGVTSRIDVLFAISGLITPQNLIDFFLAAEAVLSEPDPALQLPDENIWLAGMSGKVRNHSSIMRKSICETLIILSIHGNDLFLERLNIDVESQVSALVHRLLSPFEIDTLKSNDRELPLYAEASPDMFLRLLEQDLKSRNPAVLGLMKPVASHAIGARCWRTSILWALECLAWNPKFLPRVSAILGNLSTLKIDDNWENKPHNSLKSIFRWWMPQTAASLVERVKTLKLLIKRFPDIAWELCVSQFSQYSDTGHGNYRPLWRQYGSGFGHPSTSSADHVGFAQQALGIALDWPSHSEKTLGDLVECLSAMGLPEQRRVWDLIEKWKRLNPDENSKATLRERIRRFALTRRGKKRSLNAGAHNRAQAAFDSLCPVDPAVRHRWLFMRDWLEETYDELDEEHLDYTKRMERIHVARSEAMREIWSCTGSFGIVELLNYSEAPGLVGRYLATCLSGNEECIEQVKYFLDHENAAISKKNNEFVRGLLDKISSETRLWILHQLAAGEPDRLVRILTLSPFSRETWNFVNEQDESVQLRYWREVFPFWYGFDAADLSEIIDRLIQVNRPRAAFRAVEMERGKISTQHIAKLLRAVVSDKSEQDEVYGLSSYDVAEFFRELDSRSELSTEEMAQLEFKFITALDHTDYGIPNFERRLTESPQLFVQLLALTCRRDDGGEDPSEWSIADEEQRSAIATASYKALRKIARLPGFIDKTEEVNFEVLSNWITETRAMLATFGRTEIGDQMIGQLLARHPFKTNGVWPCKAVCEALEEFGSIEIARGFSIQVYNSRGVTSRGLGDGGAQERELVIRYRGWAQHLAFEYPYVSSILEHLADDYQSEAEKQDVAVKLRKRLPGR